MPSSRNICVVTGSRADFGILTPVMRQIASDPRLQLMVAVTGMHLSKRFGMTVQQIRSAGFPVDIEIPVLSDSDSSQSVTQAMARGLSGFADALEEKRPDILVVLGDRFEILPPVIAAVMANISVAHLHGGEITEGAIDDSIRHAITKMSSLHFVSHETHRKRVIQMGEVPERVFNFGSPAIDNILQMKRNLRQELEQVLDCQFGKQNFLITYHPATRSDEQGGFLELLNALDDFPQFHLFFTLPNADPGNAQIRKQCEHFVYQNRGRAWAFEALGTQIYMSLVDQVDVVVGNSSSALIEVPALKKPSVNVGDRQKGRLHGPTVIDCPAKRSAICSAINQATSIQFGAVVEQSSSPFGCGDASVQIKNVLCEIALDNLLQKRFHNI